MFASVLLTIREITKWPFIYPLSINSYDFGWRYDLCWLEFLSISQWPLCNSEIYQYEDKLNEFLIIVKHSNYSYISITVSDRYRLKASSETEHLELQAFVFIISKYGNWLRWCSASFEGFFELLTSICETFKDMHQGIFCQLHQK